MGSAVGGQTHRSVPPCRGRTDFRVVLDAEPVVQHEGSVQAGKVERHSDQDHQDDAESGRAPRTVARLPWIRLLPCYTRWLAADRVRGEVGIIPFCSTSLQHEEHNRSSRDSGHVRSLYYLPHAERCLFAPAPNTSHGTAQRRHDPMKKLLAARSSRHP